MEPEARPSPSPSPHRSPPPTGAADGPRAADPRPPPPLAQMHQQEKEHQQEEEQRGAGGDWSEEPLSPTPPLPVSSAAATVLVSHAAKYVPPRAVERTAVDPGRGGYGGDDQSWYSWNGGRSKDRRRATPPPSARMQPQPHPRAHPEPQPHPSPRAHPEPKPRPHPRAAPPPPLPLQPRVAPPPVRVPMPPPPPPLSPAPVPASLVERDLRYVPDVMTRKRRTAVLQRTALVARAAAAVLCLAALAVLAGDTRKGWALDSYSNYTQFRYSEAVNVIGFLYSVFQFFALATHLRRKRHLIPRPKGDYFDFTMDQVLAYLLISSSSSATAATGDWIDNWGSDPFPNMANSSIAISFMAFVVFAINSLISAYNLFRRDL